MLYSVSALAREALAIGRDIMREISTALEALSAELIAIQDLNAKLAARIEALEETARFHRLRIDIATNRINYQGDKIEALEATSLNAVSLNDEAQ
jgi:hypothetical protein